MEVISTIVAFLCGVCFVSTPVLLVIFIIMLCLKSKKKKTIGFITLGVAISIVPLSIIGVLTDPATWCEHQWTVTEVKEPTCTDKGYISKHCPLCDKTDTEYENTLSHSWEITEKVEPTCTDKGYTVKRCPMCGETTKDESVALGHNMEEVSKVVPTYVAEGSLTSKCSRCAYCETKILEKLNCTHEWVEVSRKDATENSMGVIEKKCKVCNDVTTEYIPKLKHVVTFAEIYKAYKENKLRADDAYKNNRYEITAKVNGMSTGGIFNITGGATLTMEIRVDNTIVFFYAEFEKEQEEALKAINVGDTITFEGECLSAGSWVECKIIK